MKAVDVFGGGDGVEEDFGVDLVGQRQLDEDAVDFVAGVEGGDEVEHGFSSDVLGRRDEVAVDAEFGAGLDLVADVNLRGGDVADEHGGEAGADALGGEDADFFGDFLLDCGGNGGAVEDSWHSIAPRNSSYRFRVAQGCTAHCDDERPIVAWEPDSVRQSVKMREPGLICDFRHASERHVTRCM